MKKISVLKMSAFSLLFTALMPAALRAQDSDDRQHLQEDVDRAKQEFIKTDPMMKNLFDNSPGYVIFPNVGKGAIGVGGAAGNGIVFENGTAVGHAKMKQVTVGFQFGGKTYREVIFFETKEALDRFKQGNFELSAQASAVAVTKGAAANVKYREGILIFTQEKGGLMYEASVGGQHFDYKAY
ncbi:MAG TPA: YSC84-related protein [Flavisolibacter sp.]|jgi:lipid-binding SYLF domain-containing protein|nr:YSC84-related protein [Flavisolibacter sp.]